jgi:hypothetical protein|tara:strand:- start:814 stop:1026 length:213 start_codon:yes stop_codon:yes gene_type:complete
MKEFIKNDIYLNALYKKYEADIVTAKANLLTYINTPVGVAEHPDMIASMDELIGKIAEAQDKLKILEEGV